MLVERKKAPNGLELVSAFRAGRHDPTDLVELAREIQLVGSPFIYLISPPKFCICVY